MTTSLQVLCDGVFVVIFLKTMYNKTMIIRFGFCDILNNQGLGKCYQPRPSAQLITLISTLIIPDITKTSSNNCLLEALIVKLIEKKGSCWKNRGYLTGESLSISLLECNLLHAPFLAFLYLFFLYLFRGWFHQPAWPGLHGWLTIKRQKIWSSDFMTTQQARLAGIPVSRWHYVWIKVTLAKRANPADVISC